MIVDWTVDFIETVGFIIHQLSLLYLGPPIQHGNMVTIASSIPEVEYVCGNDGDGIFILFL